MTGFHPTGATLGAVGAALTGGSAAGMGQAANGYDVVCPYDLAIPAETSLSMSVTLQQAFVPTGVAPVGNLCIQACFYGFDVTAIQG